MKSTLLVAVAVAALAPLIQPPLPDAEREAAARRLEAQLIAPCCWRQPVADHASPAADQIKADIRRQLAQGKEPQQILDSYVAGYGQRILSSPRAEGFNLLAYAVPVLLLAAGGVGLLLTLRRWRERRRAAASAAPPAELVERVERELGER